MATVLDNFQIPRNPHAELPVCNTSSTVDIHAGDVLSIDTANPVSDTQTGIGVLQGVSGVVPFAVAIDNMPAINNNGGSASQGRAQILGLIQVVASGAISAGAIVVPDAAGQVKTSPGATAQLGQALTPASSAGDQLLIKIDIANDA